MYLASGMNRLIDSFKIGFLSDRVVNALSKYSDENPQKLEQNEKVALADGASFLEKVLNGKRQMSTGDFGKNALESITFYNKSVSIVLVMPDFKKFTSKDIESIFNELKSNLTQIAEGKHVPKEEILKVKTFFNYLSKETLEDSNAIIDGVYESRSADKWEFHLET